MRAWDLRSLKASKMPAPEPASLGLSSACATHVTARQGVRSRRAWQTRADARAEEQRRKRSDNKWTSVDDAMDQALDQIDMEAQAGPLKDLMRLGAWFRGVQPTQGRRWLHSEQRSGQGNPEHDVYELGASFGVP